MKHRADAMVSPQTVIKTNYQQGEMLQHVEKYNQMLFSLEESCFQQESKQKFI